MRRARPTTASFAFAETSQIEQTKSKPAQEKKNSKPENPVQRQTRIGAQSIRSKLIKKIECSFDRKAAPSCSFSFRRQMTLGTNDARLSNQQEVRISTQNFEKGREIGNISHFSKNNQTISSFQENIPEESHQVPVSSRLPNKQLGVPSSERRHTGTMTAMGLQSQPRKPFKSFDKSPRTIPQTRSPVFDSFISLKYDKSIDPIEHSDVYWSLHQNSEHFVVSKNQNIRFHVKKHSVSKQPQKKGTGNFSGAYDDPALLDNPLQTLPDDSTTSKNSLIFRGFPVGVRNNRVFKSEDDGRDQKVQQESTGHMRVESHLKDRESHSSKNKAENDFKERRKNEKEKEKKVKRENDKNSQIKSPPNDFQKRQYKAITNTAELQRNSAQNNEAIPNVNNDGLGLDTDQIKEKNNELLSLLEEKQFREDMESLENRLVQSPKERRAAETAQMQGVQLFIESRRQQSESGLISTEQILSEIMEQVPGKFKIVQMNPESRVLLEDLQKPKGLEMTKQAIDFFNSALRRASEKMEAFNKSCQVHPINCQECFKTTNDRLTTIELADIKKAFETKNENPEEFLAEKVVPLLEKFGFFRQFSRSLQLALLKQASWAEFNSGDVIFKQGDEGVLMYIILKGSCKVKVFGKNEVMNRDEEKLVASLFDGASFGEYAMLGTNSKRKFLNIGKLKRLKRPKAMGNEKGNEEKNDRKDLDFQEEDEGSEINKGDFRERCKRVATIECSEHCEMLFLNRKHYSQIVMAQMQLEIEDKLRVLSVIPFLEVKCP